MRKLVASDIMSFCRCIKKIGVKDEIKKIAMSADSGKDAWNKGFELIYNIFDLATEKNGEANIYEFLSGPFEMPAEDVKNMELPEFITAVKKLATENNLMAFFGSATALMR